MLTTLFRPFQHPRTHFVVVTATDYGPDLPLNGSARSDAESLHTLSPVLSHSLGATDTENSIALSDPGQFTATLDALSQRVAGNRDVLIVYLSAHTIVDDGRAYLLCENVSLDNYRAGRLPLRELLQRLAESPARLKLLLLDTGRIHDDRRLGTTLADAPRIIRREVESFGDPTLWVMVSNSAGERSYQWGAGQGTLFGEQVALGFAGEADHNGDRVIGLDEICDYVVRAVAADAHRLSQGGVSQHPLVLWGGGSEGGKPPAMPLISIASLKETEQATDSEEESGSAEERFRGAAEVAGIQVKSSDQIAAEARSDITPGSGVGAQAVSATRRSQSGSAVDDEDESGQTTDGDATQDEAEANRAEEDSTDVDSAASALEGLLRDELLVEAWRRIDAIESEAPSLVAAAPHRWQQLRFQMLRLDQVIRRGEDDGDSPPAVLVDLVVDLGRLSTAAPSNATQNPPEGHIQFDTLRSTVTQRRQAEIFLEHHHSLAMALRFPAGGADGVARLSEEFAARLASGTQGPLEQWLAELEPDHFYFVEVRLAQQFLSANVLPWEVVQAAVRSRLLAEQVAACDPRLFPWISEDLAAADLLQWEAERELREAVSPSRVQIAVEQVRQAESDYRSIADKLEILQQAEMIASQLLLRAPDYVRLVSLARRLRGIEPPAVDDVSMLLVQLQELRRMLEAPQPAEWSRLRDTSEQLAELRTQIDASLTNRTLLANLADLSPPARNWTASSLLKLSLPTADTRQALLTMLQNGESGGPGRGNPPSSPELAPLTHGDWVDLARESQLEWQLAQLAQPPTDRNDIYLERLNNSWDTLANGSLRSGDTSYDAADRWQHQRQFADALSDFYRTLPQRVTAALSESTSLNDPGKRSERIHRLRACERSLYLIDARDATRVQASGLLAQLMFAVSRDMLATHVERFRQAATYADTSRQFLEAAGENYRRQAIAMSSTPWIEPITRQPLRVTGPAEVGLVLQSAQDIGFDIRVTTLSEEPVLVVLDYDPNTLSVQPLADLQIIHEPLSQQGRTTSRTMRRPGASSSTPGGEPIGETWSNQAAEYPTATIKPGELFRIPLRVTRINSSAPRARLVVMAITENGAVRHTTEFRLPIEPEVRLTVEGIAETWTAQGARLVLHPFPNRVTDYRLLMNNHGSRDQVVDIEIRAISSEESVAIPHAELIREEVDAVLAALGAEEVVATVPDVEIRGGAPAVPIPFPEPADPSVSGPPPPEDTDGEQAATPMAKGDLDIALGVVVIATDQETGRSSLYRVDVLPQQPARFLEPNVRYDEEFQRVEIEVKGVRPQTLPSEPIEVTAEFSEPLAVDAERRLTAQLSRNEPTCRLYADVTLERNTQLDLHLHVDGYPRAFRYKLINHQGRVVVTPAQDELAVRIVEPMADAAVQSPLDEITVRLEVDAPEGTFPGPSSVIEVGLDVDRDRELDGDDIHRLTADRQVAARIDFFAPEGAVMVSTRVDDFQIQLSTIGLANTRANVVARLSAFPNEVWSTPVEVKFDASGPRISQPRLSADGFVVIGDRIEITVIVSDAGMSGVEKVEAGFDLDRTGEFSAAGPTILGKAQEAGRWILRIPTAGMAPEPYHLLLRATDRVGNEGPFEKLPIHLVTEEQAAALIALRTNRVHGTILYGGSGAAAVEVQLATAEGGAFQQTVTREGGAFVFEDVPPGEYLVQASGVVRNKQRTGEAEVSVPPAPELVEPVQLEVR